MKRRVFTPLLLLLAVSWPTGPVQSVAAPFTSPTSLSQGTAPAEDSATLLAGDEDASPAEGSADHPGREAISRVSTGPCGTDPAGPRCASYWLPAYKLRSDPLSPRLLNPVGSKAHPFLKTAGIDRTSDQRLLDPWVGWDKVQHVTFSFLFTVGSQYALVNKAGMGERGALPVSMGVSGAIGLAKELNDRYRGPSRYFSKRDLLADTAGILLAAGFILL